MNALLSSYYMYYIYIFLSGFISVLFVLQARLKFAISNPTSEELVHHVFKPLEMVNACVCIICLLIFLLRRQQSFQGLCCAALFQEFHQMFAHYCVEKGLIRLKQIIPLYLRVFVGREGYGRSWFRCVRLQPGYDTRSRDSATEQPDDTGTCIVDLFRAQLDTT